MPLDPRLGLLAHCVGDASRVADIGADHGILAEALLLSNPARQMVVADISAESLDKARKRLGEAGLLSRVTLRVADGLDALDGPADAIVIAGMGAKVIKAILTQGLKRIGRARLILQPNLDAHFLRAWLLAHGFRLLDEHLAEAAGRFYVVICAQVGESPAYRDKAVYLGPCLMAKRPQGWTAYLHWRKSVLSHALSHIAQSTSPHNQSRTHALRSQIAWIEEELPCP